MKTKYWLMIGIVVLLVGGILAEVSINSEERKIEKEKQKYGTEFGYYETGKPETFVPLFKDDSKELGSIN